MTRELALRSPPALAVVLGSGLGGVSDALEERRTVDAASLPHAPRPSVRGHDARIHAGRLRGIECLILAGRVHLYEGHDIDAVTRPVRAVAALGARALLLTNTAGSCRAELAPGTILLTRDVLHWMGTRGPRHAGPRETPAADADGGRPGSGAAALASRVHAAARAGGILLEGGVLAAGLGPCYETAAEVAMLRRLGADALTMSTVPEFAAANASGLPAAILTVLTNYATGIVPGAHLTHTEVTERGGRAARSLATIIAGVAASMECDRHREEG